MLVHSLKRKDRQALEKSLNPRLTKYIPHSPHPKQRAFLLLDDRDAFYGGAAGGGKSDALLMAALQYVDISGYSALLLRDSFSNLVMPGALLDRAHEWLDDWDDVKWDGESKTFRFNSGATLTFGYLDGPRDHLKYKSAEFQFIGLDEASDLRWSQINYMFSRLRRLKNVKIPIRFRLASNPGGISHEDIKVKYVDPKTRREDVIFIPAGLADNPFLDNEEYEHSLMELDPINRARLLRGDWDIREKGRMFDRNWFTFVDEAPSLENIIATVRYWDLAGTKKTPGNDPAFTVGVKMSLTKQHQYIITSVVRFRKEPAGVEATIRQVADMDGKGVHIWMEQEPGSSGKNTISHYRRSILPDMVFRGDATGGRSKPQRAAPFSSQVEAGNVKLLRAHWNEAFIDECEMFPDGNYKDQVDAGSGAFNKLAKGFMGSIRVRTVNRKRR